MFTLFYTLQKNEMTIKVELIQMLNHYYEKYNQKDFIKDDPISIPHLFSQKQDIEIMGLWVAMLSWGLRKTIISKSNLLLQLMGNEPYKFITEHKTSDLKPFLDFKHRTFNGTDTLYFIESLRNIYQNFNSLEDAFIPKRFSESNFSNTESCLIHFNQYFFSLPDFPKRTQKHISSPQNSSACKRLNMFLRWMVRKDKKGVDFGIWNQIKMHQLVCPLDVHVERVARHLGLIERKNSDWKTAVELTENLKIYSSSDPVKYDFALFGMGLEGFGKE